MRILVISDLHANWPALEAVLAAESFDQAMVVGDLVAYGPNPAEVVDWVSRHASAAVEGNHDDALACGSDCRCSPASKPLAIATREVHKAMLTPEQIRFLGGLPQTRALDVSGRRFFAVHASPRSHLYRYTLTPTASERHLRNQLSGVRADYVLLGHTHFPMVRVSGEKTVINPGSVGQPRDGDPRASYAVIEDGVPTLRRVAYDVERAVGDLKRLPLDAAVTDRLSSILRNGR
jgi:putative phosphoesterase